MIYGISHSRFHWRFVVGVPHKMIRLGKRSRRHQLRQRDAWRSEWPICPRESMGLRVTWPTFCSVYDRLHALADGDQPTTARRM